MRVHLSKHSNSTARERFGSPPRSGVHTRFGAPSRGSVRRHRANKPGRACRNKEIIAHPWQRVPPAPATQLTRATNFTSARFRSRRPARLCAAPWRGEKWINKDSPKNLLIDLVTHRRCVCIYMQWIPTYTLVEECRISLTLLSFL